MVKVGDLQYLQMSLCLWGSFCLQEFKHFVLVQATYGLAVPFLFFCVISALGIIFTVLCVPETKGKTLEQIEDEFRNLKTPRDDDNS